MVRSADTLLDITSVYLDPTIYMGTSTDWYSIRTYVQVNPTDWHINERINPMPFDETEAATIYYRNVPSVEHMRFTSKQSNNWGYTYAGSDLTLTYERQLPTDLAYLMLPASGMYIFTDVTSPETYVDFSQAMPTLKRWQKGMASDFYKGEGGGYYCSDERGRKNT